MTTTYFPSAVTHVFDGDGPATILEFSLSGTPAPQGSKTKGRWGNIIDDNAKTLEPWRAAVTMAARSAHRRSRLPVIAGAVRIEATVFLARPKGHYRTGRFSHLLRDDAPRYPIARGVGDSDKFLRAISDAITDSGLWLDDVLVIKSTCAKEYADLAESGAHIKITILRQEQDRAA